MCFNKFQPVLFSSWAVHSPTAVSSDGRLMLSTHPQGSWLLASSKKSTFMACWLLLWTCNLEKTKKCFCEAPFGWQIMNSPLNLLIQVWIQATSLKRQGLNRGNIVWMSSFLCFFNSWPFVKRYTMGRVLLDAFPGTLAALDCISLHATWPATTDISF